MNTDSTITANTLDIDRIRRDFPILHQEVNGRPLIYLDNAATTQKPQSVIDALTRYYQEDNANIHRGIHTLAERATSAFEETRKAVHQFIGSNEPEEIVFTKGTTEGINLVASTFGRINVQKGDEIIISAMEHHSNIVPWQMLCEEKGAKLNIIPVNDRGEIELEEYKKLLSDRTKLVSIVYVSNSLGTVNPVKEIIQLAHDYGAAVMIDGAQSTAYLDINVQSLDCDFYTFSGHKIFGPTGIGVLYGKRRHLEKMPPYQGGGEMIRSVSFEETTYNDIPYKFEAGTPNIADVVALKAAIDYINQLGKAQMRAHEETLLAYAQEKLQEISGLRMIGTAENKMNVLSFIFDDIFHFDVGQMLDARGIAVRTGHHCTEPLMQRYGIEGTVRASLAVYNTREEIDKLTEGLHRIVSMMRR